MPTTTTTKPPTTTTTAVPGSNCSATLSGYTLGRAGWTASTNAPSNSANAPANALDGNYSTPFGTGEAQVPGLYFEVNLGSAQTFEELKMSTPSRPTDYARGYDVQVSKDGASWTTVAACTGTSTPEVVSFNAQTAQYVRVVLSVAESPYWWSVDEFNLYSATPPPPPTTTTTTVPPHDYDPAAAATHLPVPRAQVPGLLAQVPGGAYADNDPPRLVRRHLPLLRPAGVRRTGPRFLPGACAHPAWPSLAHRMAVELARPAGSADGQAVGRAPRGRDAWVRWNGRLHFALNCTTSA